MPEGNGRKPKSNEPQRPSGPNMRIPSRGVVSWMMFLALAILLVVMLTGGMNNPKPISISEFTTLMKNKQIDQLTIKGERVVGIRKTSDRQEPREFEVLYGEVDNETQQKWVDALGDGQVKREEPSYWVPILVNMLPWLFIFLFLWFVIIRQFRAAGGGAGMLGNFGRSRHRVTSKEHVDVNFADVAGIEEAKEEVQELIEFLKNPKRFQRLGGRIPRGVLLVGQPGCGKTLLAKAIAGEADVPFFSISGSDFVEMFVGVGASRVRDLFKQAKENSPCIIFLDEIDAVGRRRGANFGGGGHDEREQTLNAILVEMDGFDTSDQVIVIAATNRVDVLDPALIRPGRFDRQVYVSLPDVQGRYEILKVHARRIALGPNVDLRRLARATPMFSGAELAAIINEAAIIATMANKDYVEMADLEEARDKVRWGRAKRSRQVDEHDQKVTAYHEAGHAVIQALLKDADPVHKVSILPRGQAAGATFSLPERDRMVYTRDYLTATLTVLFGGRIAEEVFFNEISSGAGMDIRQGTAIARKMVMEFGMNDELGFIFYGDSDSTSPFEGLGQREYSEDTARLIDAEIKKLIDRQYKKAEQMVAEHRDKVVAVAEALLKYETLTGDEVNRLLRGDSLDKPTISDLLDAEDATGGLKVGRARPVKPARDENLGLGGTELPAPG